MGRILAALAACLVALAGAPPAAADETSYLRELRAKVEAPLTDSEALQLGSAACGAMRSALDSGASFGQARSAADQAVGHSARALTVDGGFGPGAGLSMPDGMFLVEAAENQLC